MGGVTGNESRAAGESESGGSCIDTDGCASVSPLSAGRLGVGRDGVSVAGEGRSAAGAAEGVGEDDGERGAGVCAAGCDGLGAGVGCVSAGRVTVPWRLKS